MNLIAALLSWLRWRARNERVLTDRAAARRVAKGEYIQEGPKVSGASNVLIAILGAIMLVLFIAAMLEGH